MIDIRTLYHPTLKFKKKKIQNIFERYNEYCPTHVIIICIVQVNSLLDAKFNFNLSFNLLFYTFFSQEATSLKPNNFLHYTMQML